MSGKYKFIGFNFLLTITDHPKIKNNKIALTNC
jgi:hypothetical protein